MHGCVINEIYISYMHNARVVKITFKIDFTTDYKIHALKSIL